MKKRKDGRYQKKITMPDGKIKFLYSSASNEKLAVKDFNEQMLNLEQKRADSLLFKNVAEEWENEHFPRLQNNSLKSYKPALASAKEYFGDFSITEIKSVHIQQYLDQLLKKGYAAKTIKNRMLVISLIIKHALLNEYIQIDPCQRVSLPQNLPKAKREAASSNDEKIISKSTDKDFGILAYLFLTTGCRRGEAAALQPKDIDLTAKTISISKTVEWIGNTPQIKNCPKTDAGFREIPITDKLIKLLSPFMKQTYIFENSKGELLDNSQFTRGWDKYVKETGISCTPHQLRHSYATMLFDAGIDVKTAQKWLGHADINTTLGIYTHISEKRLEKTTNKITKYIEKHY